MSIKQLLILMIFALASSPSRAEDWGYISQSKEMQIYIHLPSVKEINTYGRNYVDAWFKEVVYNDLTKDGLTVGDYKKVRLRFDCSNKELQRLSTTTYKANGQVIDYFDYRYSSSLEYTVPESIGEAKLDAACYVNDIHQGRINE